MGIVEAIYQAAANAGLLKRCTWHPSDGGPPQSHSVGLRAPDESLLDNLTLSRETTMSYPSTLFEGLAAGEVVEIEGQRFLVREVCAIGDGREMHAKLTRL